MLRRQRHVVRRWHRRRWRQNQSTCLFLYAWMNPSAVFISGSIFELIFKTSDFCKSLQNLHDVMFVCKASLCVCKRVYSTDAVERNRLGLLCSDSSQTIDMSVWMTWWAWNWLQLLCTNTPSILTTTHVTNKRIKTSQYGECVQINILRNHNLIIHATLFV